LGKSGSRGVVPEIANRGGGAMDIAEWGALSYISGTLSKVYFW